MSRRPAFKSFLCVIIFMLITPFLIEAAPVGKITRLEGKVDVLKAGQNTLPAFPWATLSMSATYTGPRRIHGPKSLFSIRIS